MKQGGSNGHLDNDDGRVGEATSVSGAECSLSAWAHLACSPVPASEWEQKPVNIETGDCSSIFSYFILSYSTCPLDQYPETRGRHNVLRATLGPVWAPDNPSLYTSTGGGHESAFISRAKRLIYFSQGIKGHCKNALCSLSNIKRVRRYKRIPVVTESKDHYETSRQRRPSKMSRAMRGNHD